jgi:hypothetical protein
MTGSSGVSSALRLLSLIIDVSEYWIARSSRAMTARYDFAFPRHQAPELGLNSPPQNEGRGATPRGERGMPGARCTRGRACRVVSTRVSHHGRTGNHPAFPHATVLTAYFALSLVTGLVCHHRLADHPAKLDASVGASGPHDFAVRKKTRSSVAPPASIASQPYVRDDRETSLCVGRDGEGYAGDLGQK